MGRGTGTGADYADKFLRIPLAEWLHTCDTRQIGCQGWRRGDDCCAHSARREHWFVSQLRYRYGGLTSLTFTDTQFYWGLTQHLFRYNHINLVGLPNRGGLHTINEGTVSRWSHETILTLTCDSHPHCVICG